LKYAPNLRGEIDFMQDLAADLTALHERFALIRGHL
jgi:hypothetical protein